MQQTRGALDAHGAGAAARGGHGRGARAARLQRARRPRQRTRLGLRALAFFFVFVVVFGAHGDFFFVFFAACGFFATRPATSGTRAFVTILFCVPNR